MAFLQHNLSIVWLRNRDDVVHGCSVIACKPARVVCALPDVLLTLTQHILTIWLEHPLRHACVLCCAVEHVWSWQVGILVGWAAFQAAAASPQHLLGHAADMVI